MIADEIGDGSFRVGVEGSRLGVPIREREPIRVGGSEPSPIAEGLERDAGIAGDLRDGPRSRDGIVK
jgi:hypothetical protein